MSDKLTRANEIIKSYIKENYYEKNWRYIDYVNEDRFFNEIKYDTSVDCEILSAEEIAEMCLNKICQAHPLEFAQNL